MLQDPLTLYKLIVLYMLNRVTFPMTTAQVSDFVLEKEYTNFLTLQQVINELLDAALISSETIRNRTHLSITAEGRETLAFFENRISDTIKEEINHYFRENEFALRNEVSVLGDYYKSTSGEYEAHLVAKDRGISLVDITISVPDEATASSICDSWQKKNQKIYQYLIQELF
jgi:DNA-binding PadR family transcriptional regulator